MNRKERAGLVFTLPVIVLIVVVLVVPAAGAVVLSVTDFDIYALGSLANLRFIGFDNYTGLLTNSLFWRAVANTAIFAIIGVPAAIGASLGAALLLNAATARLRPLWRLLLFAPFVTTLVATAVVWRYLLGTRNGLLNAGLALLGLGPVDWLGDPRTSIPSVILFVVWQVFGYNMLIFTAALATAPADLYEAASLDGAGALTRFRHVTLPAIGPALLLAAILSVTSFMQIFTEPYVMTHGGPALSTVTILYFMFNEGFEWWSLGSASAVAVLLTIVVLALTSVQTRIGRRFEWL